MSCRGSRRGEDKKVVADSTYGDIDAGVPYGIHQRTNIRRLGCLLHTIRGQAVAETISARSRHRGEG